VSVLKRRALVGLVLVLASSAQGQQQASAPAAPAQVAGAIAKARAFVTDTMTKLGAPGAQLTVMRAGRIIWSEGFGFADLEQQVRVTPTTRFRVGSVSKSLTSALLGKLVEQGKLDLDAPVQKYVPSFPVKKWPITTRQVGGHLAGIRHYDRDEENVVYQHYSDVVAGLAVFANDSLRFQPGTKYSYSSYGWNLISAVLQGAGGEPYLAQMQRQVFDAAELRHTSPDQVDSIIPGRARWYTRTSRGPGGRVVNAPFTDNSYKWAGGGFISTTDDLVTYGDAMLHGRLLKPETVKLLWTSQKTLDGKETGYGIGWGVGRDAAGRERISHSGGSVGGTAMLIIYPKEDLIIAMLVNSDVTFVGSTSRIAEMFLAP
jgi:CubicO group peptidase (beta-lactamase class C family)